MHGTHDCNRMQNTYSNKKKCWKRNEDSTTKWGKLKKEEDNRIWDCERGEAKQNGEENCAHCIHKIFRIFFVIVFVVVSSSCHSFVHNSFNFHCAPAHAGDATQYVLFCSHITRDFVLLNIIALISYLFKFPIFFGQIFSPFSMVCDRNAFPAFEQLFNEVRYDCTS